MTAPQYRFTLRPSTVAWTIAPSTARIDTVCREQKADRIPQVEMHASPEEKVQGQRERENNRCQDGGTVVPCLVAIR